MQLPRQSQSLFCPGRTHGRSPFVIKGFIGFLQSPGAESFAGWISKCSIRVTFLSTERQIIETGISNPQLRR
jgi:hypothetical protein